MSIQRRERKADGTFGSILPVERMDRQPTNEEMTAMMLTMMMAELDTVRAEKEALEARVADLEAAAGGEPSV